MAKLEENIHISIVKIRDRTMLSHNKWLHSPDNAWNLDSLEVIWRVRKLSHLNQVKLAFRSEVWECESENVPYYKGKKPIKNLESVGLLPIIYSHVIPNSPHALHHLICVGLKPHLHLVRWDLNRNGSKLTKLRLWGSVLYRVWIGMAPDSQSWDCGQVSFRVESRS